MLRLPLLAPHQATLEKCVYCPKLSRAACPVSNAEASETVTPWGKMSMAYFVARGDVPADALHGEPAWACTACYACRERCDHRNEVATVLTDARAELFARGAAPEGAVAVASRWVTRASEAERAMDRVASNVASQGGGAPVAHVVVGCGYALHAPEVARDALVATSRLAGGPVRAVRACCGLPLLYAGDRAGFAMAARRLAEELAGARRVIGVEPGCTRAIAIEYARAGVDVPTPEPFVDLAHAALDRLRPPASGPTEVVRYHDPCQLGRGLGRFDEPRRVLERITGRPPRAFLREREHAECSGAGGLLPATRPATSRAIADERIAEHRRLGGGRLVTACAQSLRRFRSRGEPAEDLVSLVARAL